MPSVINKAEGPVIDPARLLAIEYPHWGQLYAESLTFDEHSGHLINGIRIIEIK